MKSKKINQLLSILFFIINCTAFAQVDVFSDEVTYKGQRVFYQKKTLTGTLYSNDQETINNDCQCSLKATYKEGNLDGYKYQWYISGSKKYEGEFLAGIKINKHIFWNKNGNISIEEYYTNGFITEQKQYYQSGKIKAHFKYNPLNTKEMIFKTLFFENGIKQLEANYRNNLKHGEYVEKDATGKTIKENVYADNNITEKKIYREGVLIESMYTIGNDLIESNLFYENGKQKIKGYYNKDLKKDSVWTTFDVEGNKITEKAYKNKKLVREGMFKNNKKDGLWKFYLANNIQKNSTYQNGEEIKTETFNTAHTLKNNYSHKDDAAILEYTAIDGTKQIITLTSDQPFTKNRTYQFILGTIARSFLERMKMLDYSAINESTEISKKIHISNMNVSYTSENVQGHVSNQYFTTYNAYISFNLVMTDAADQKLFARSYKFNKSGKLLNALLNVAVQTYATTKEKAFQSALKSIKFKKLTKKYFPIKKTRK